MTKQSIISALTVSSLLNNLSAISLGNDSVLSNAAKSAERVEWFTQSIKENRLTDFAGLIEQAINNLPEGTVEVATIHPVTGKLGTKKINKRDIAKASYKTAFGHAAKGTTYSHQVMTFKLSTPTLTDKSAPATLEQKFARLLEGTVSGKQLAELFSLTEKFQVEYKIETAKLASNHLAAEKKNLLIADIAMFAQRKGVTLEQAQEKAALVNDMTVEELKVAIA